ncbi:DUF397 domain-containing protein [Kitasatospora sp. NPDC057541]|uniref:DUF397 domain-containing protein n=1 Tax=unclassified Kitasatospora TaxID=2633591 RepID=UPI0036CB7F7F
MKPNASTPVHWRKSSYSSNGGQCVEVATPHLTTVHVRDSKDPDGPALLFPAPAWHPFLTAVRAGEFDIL